MTRDPSARQEGWQGANHSNRNNNDKNKNDNDNNNNNNKLAGYTWTEESLALLWVHVSTFGTSEHHRQDGVELVSGWASLSGSDMRLRCCFCDEGWLMMEETGRWREERARLIFLFLFGATELVKVWRSNKLALPFV